MDSPKALACRSTTFTGGLETLNFETESLRSGVRRTGELDRCLQSAEEAASELVDDWCDGALNDLSLVDVLSLEAFGEGWELAIILRADGSAVRKDLASGAEEGLTFPHG